MAGALGSTFSASRQNYGMNSWSRVRFRPCFVQMGINLPHAVSVLVCVVANHTIVRLGQR